MIAINLNSGKTSWAKDATSTYVTPLTYQDKLMFITQSGNLYCLNKYSGEEVWRQEVGDFVKSQPLISDDNIITISSTGELKITSTKNGEILCTENLDISVLSALVRVQSNLLVTSLNGLIICYHLAEDKLTKLWQVQLDDAIKNTPVSDGKSIYLITVHGKIHQLSLKTGKIMSVVDREELVIAPPLLAGTSLIYSTLLGDLIAWDLTKQEVRWSKKFTPNSPAGPIYYDGKVIFVSTKGEILCLD